MLSMQWISSYNLGIDNNSIIIYYWNNLPLTAFYWKIYISLIMALSTIRIRE